MFVSHKIKVKAEDDCSIHRVITFIVSALIFMKLIDNFNIVWD